MNFIKNYIDMKWEYVDNNPRKSVDQLGKRFDCWYDDHVLFWMFFSTGSM